MAVAMLSAAQPSCVLQAARRTPHAATTAVNRCPRRRPTVCSASAAQAADALGKGPVPGVSGNGAARTPQPPPPPPPPPHLLSPPAAYAALVQAGANKAALSVQKTFLHAVLAGAYIALGALLMLSCGASCPGLASSNPGARAALLGLMGLPLGLLITIATGAELFTGNTAIVAAAFLERRATLRQLAKNWGVSFGGNLVGALLVALIAVSAGVAATTGPAAAVAVAKTSLTWAQAFWRGVIGSWLVCLAVLMATAASSLASKAVAIVLPISAFVAIGGEHAIANLFLLPTGIMTGAGVSVQAALSNIVPVALGNTVAGAVLVAAAYSVAYGGTPKPERP